MSRSGAASTTFVATAREIAFAVGCIASPKFRIKVDVDYITLPDATRTVLGYLGVTQGDMAVAAAPAATPATNHMVRIVAPLSGDVMVPRSGKITATVQTTDPVEPAEGAVKARAVPLDTDVALPWSNLEQDESNPGRYTGEIAAPHSAAGELFRIEAVADFKNHGTEQDSKCCFNGITQ